jgi:hypothetical protein
MRGAQALHRLLALLRRSEDADEHARVAQVSAGLHVGDGHEADSGVLEVTVAQSVAENLANRLVNPAHPLSGHPNHPPLRTI